MEALRASAEATARQLDAFLPRWHKQIDKERLNMRRSCDCIGGQIFGHFLHSDLSPLGYRIDPTLSDGDERSARLQWGFENGLSADPSLSPDAQEVQFKRLRAIWRDIVDQGLAA